MKFRLRRLIISALPQCGLIVLASANASVPAPAGLADGASDAQPVRARFAQPGRDYSSSPLWVWDDALTEEQVRGTLRDLAAQHVRQVIVHPRPGLMTPYLSEEWFRLWRAALDEAARLDMNCWIYDENSYPTGFGGGIVPEQMPESRGMGVVFDEVKTPPAPSPDVFALYRLEGERALDVTADFLAGRLTREGTFLVARHVWAKQEVWLGGRTYVDLLRPGVTQKFLETTHERYAREIGGEFGRCVPGTFADEPHIRPGEGMTWTPDLPRQFERLAGYPLLPSYPSMAREIGDWKKVRHNYAKVLNHLFVERWARPHYEWAERHDLRLTGHYWEHEWPQTLLTPDNMTMASWQHLPGIDCLSNQYSEEVFGQFGNIRSVREVNSIANQLGRARTLCEIYGAGGLDLRFEDMKRIADWLGVLGINFFDEDLSYISMRGARKRDHPQSFSYHEPWWEAYHEHEDYLTRLGFALSQDRQVNRVLVLEPTTTVWMYQGHGRGLGGIYSTFTPLLKGLEAAQIEYDLGCEDVIARHGANADAQLVVGQQRYHTVVLPPWTENLEATTAALLERFLRDGGRVLCAGEPPERIDGVVSPRGRQLAALPGWHRVEPAALPGLLRQIGNPDGFALEREAGDRGMLFHHRRQLPGGELVLLVNTSDTQPTRGVLRAERGGVERWDLRTGRCAPAQFTRVGRQVAFDFALPPAGSLLLYLPQTPIAPSQAVAETAVELAPLGAPDIHRVASNVLTLDHVDVTAGGESRTGLYCFKANQFVFEKNGMARNAWDNAVQYRDEVLRHRFAPDSGFSATYRFTVTDAVPPDLAIVIERPDIYSITCNGQPVQAAPGEWWLDRSFGRIPLAATARLGENAVTIRAAPFTLLHELEPAYVLGDFALRPAAQGFAITPAVPLASGKWNEQGLPFYAAGVAYTQRHPVETRRGRYVVTLPAWLGSVARVTVNAQLAGYVSARAGEIDVTDHIVAEENRITVTVIGTLRNTLGPHHGNFPLGSAWPSMFQTAPEGDRQPAGERYSSVGYGLFGAFGLTEFRPVAL